MKEQSPSICNYFVDEAGDSNLFNSKGRVIVRTEGCSRFFILGLLDVPDTVTLANELTALRQRLLADPYFKGVPSMQPEARKTALAFHAKDDAPEVRREVFSLLLQHNLRFFAIVRDKHKVVEYVRQRNERNKPRSGSFLRHRQKTLAFRLWIIFCGLCNVYTNDARNAMSPPYGQLSGWFMM